MHWLSGLFETLAKQQSTAHISYFIYTFRIQLVSNFTIHQQQCTQFWKPKRESKRKRKPDKFHKAEKYQKVFLCVCFFHFTSLVRCVCVKAKSIILQNVIINNYNLDTHTHRELKIIIFCCVCVFHLALLKKIDTRDENAIIRQALAWPQKFGTTQSRESQ